MTTGRKLLIFSGAGIVLLVLLTVAIHFYLRLTLSRYHTRLTAGGEELRLEQLLPRGIPSDENGGPEIRLFAGQLRPLAGQQAKFSEASSCALVPLSTRTAIPGWKQPDIRTSRASVTNSWQDLDEEMKKLAPVLENIRTALQKPHFDFNLNYFQTFSIRMQHLSGLVSVNQALLSSMLLNLHNGHADRALFDLETSIDLIRVLEDEPLSISQSVRSRQLDHAFRGTWEFLHAEGITDKQLAELADRWRQVDLLKKSLSTLQFERSMIVQECSQLRESDSHYQHLVAMYQPGPGSRPNRDIAEILADSGEEVVAQVQALVWRHFTSYDDEHDCLVLMQAAIDNARQPATNRARAAEEKRLTDVARNLRLPSAQVGEEPFSSHDSFSMRHFMADAAFNASRTMLRAFVAETEKQMALTAIGLRRYKLRHGQFPESLSALVPEFLPALPIDCMDGQPMRYRLLADGDFLLYSVGTDGKDNGAEDAPLPKLGRTWTSLSDWVWPHAAAPAAIDAYNKRVGEEIGNAWRAQHWRSLKGGPPK